MIFKSEGAQGDLNGFLDAGSQIQGELRFEHTFRVDGKVTGTVVSNGDLLVGETGNIEGEVRVGEVFVSGTVRGQVQAGRKVHIAPTGKVFAELDTPSLVIEDGAVFQGRCAMEAPAGKGEKGTAISSVVAQLPIAKDKSRATGKE